MAKKKQAVSNEVILKTVLNMGEQIAEIKSTMATKDDLIRVKEELLDEIRPIRKAQDKDAVTIINHERRIVRLEQR